MLDLQKASLLKRVSAYILDMILVMILAVGFACAFSWMFGYAKHEATLDERRDFYIEKYGLEEYANGFALSDTEFEKLTDAQKEAYTSATEEFEKDPEANHAWGMVISLSFLILTLSVLFTYLVLEFIIPLVLGGGMSVGRKVFAVGVMHENYVKLKPTTLFVRSILGKCTIETMVPVYLVLLILFGELGIVGTIVLVGMLALQLILIFTTKTHATIHDLLAHTVAVDYASQMIFENEEEMLRYKSERAREVAERESY